MARSTHAAWYAAKNASNILAVAVGWGKAEAEKQRGRMGMRTENHEWRMRPPSKRTHVGH